jgi:hypothetical protein
VRSIVDSQSEAPLPTRARNPSQATLTVGATPPARRTSAPSPPPMPLPPTSLSQFSPAAPVVTAAAAATPVRRPTPAVAGAPSVPSRPAPPPSDASASGGGAGSAGDKSLSDSFSVVASQAALKSLDGTADPRDRTIMACDRLHLCFYLMLTRNRL